MIKLGFVCHDHRRKLNTNELNELTKTIKEPSVLTKIPTFSSDHAYVVHANSFDLKTSLTTEEFNRLWEVFEPLSYGDVDGFPDEIRNAYDNGIITLSLEQLKKLL
jgi:hypothetical protein